MSGVRFFRPPVLTPEERKAGVRPGPQSTHPAADSLFGVASRDLTNVLKALNDLKRYESTGRLDLSVEYLGDVWDAAQGSMKGLLRALDEAVARYDAEHPDEALS